MPPLHQARGYPVLFRGLAAGDAGAVEGVVVEDIGVDGVRGYPLAVAHD